MGVSLNDPKIIGIMPILSTPYVIITILSLAASPLRNPLLLHDVLVSRILPHIRLTHVFLRRNILPG